MDFSRERRCQSSGIHHNGTCWHNNCPHHSEDQTHVRRFSPGVDWRVSSPDANRFPFGNAESVSLKTALVVTEETWPACYGPKEPVSDQILWEDSFPLVQLATVEPYECAPRSTRMPLLAVGLYGHHLELHSNHATKVTRCTRQSDQTDRTNQTNNPTVQLSISAGTINHTEVKQWSISAWTVQQQQNSAQDQFNQT